MRLTNEMIEVLLEIERRIGNSCYNPHSYDGWNKIHGKEYRYHPTFQIVEGEETRLKRGYSFDEISTENFETLHYRFGANHLYVGEAIISALNMLEKRYGLDFNTLEEQHQQSKT